ncbi:MAG: hypothetical protein IJ737_02540 [Ruminococcus sp.]|nr:hypothetical protein [Ruminococcus sp.]
MIESFDLSIVKMSDINETLKLIKADIRFIDDNRVNSREEYINFKNGIYDIKNRKLIEHNYKFISTIQIDSDFDPSKTECPIFDKYLDTLTSGDKEKQTLLLEFMAVCISNIEGKHMKQALFLYGPGDTGKSQLLILTQKLLGEGNYSVSNLKTLEDRFGKTSLFHKRLCGTGDMSFISIEELEVFKSATGGDQINMEFKNKNSYPYYYKGLLWFCTNGLPRFGGDHGDWVYNRMLLVNVNNVIPPEERDSHFIDKVYQEKEAIIQKLIPYLERVISNNFKFDVPASVKANIEKYKIENSPVRAFITECCEPCPANEACVTNSTESFVYDVFSIWYKNNVKSYGCISHQKFKTELSNYFGEDISNLEYRTSTARYYPLRLTIDSYNKYLQNSNNNFF